MRVLKLILTKYPWAVMAPLVGGIILVGVSTAYTMYRAFTYTPPSLPTGKEVTTDTPATRPQLDHYAVIVQRDLFTAAVSGAEERTESDQSKPRAAAVTFKLRGTVVVSSGSSCAIIEDPANKEEEIFHENDVVQGYKIVKIMRNKVIVDKEGVEEVVEVVEEEVRSPARPASPVQRPRQIIRRPVRTPVPIQRPPAATQGGS
jgi:type II secretory pathway component PulC